MTTGAMVSGAIPLAIAAGAGAESRQEIGWVIVGGMTFGTLLTLFVVPTAYTFLARDRSRSAIAQADAPRPVREAAESGPSTVMPRLDPRIQGDRPVACSVPPARGPRGPR